MTLLLPSLVTKHTVFRVKPSYNSYSWVTKRIIAGYSWGQYLWRRARSNTVQREKWNCDTIATETSANPESSGGWDYPPSFPTETNLYPSPTTRLNRRQGSFSQPMTILGETKNHEQSTLLSCSWRMSVFLGPKRSLGSTRQHLYRPVEYPLAPLLLAI